MRPLCQGRGGWALRAIRSDGIRLSTAVTALLVATPLVAQERAAGFLDFQDAIPQVRVAVSGGGARVELKLLRVDTLFFGPFSLGSSEDLTPGQLQTFDGLTTNLTSDQFLFIRGTADVYRWGNRYKDMESPRLNRSLAQERARWAQVRAGTGEILRPRIDMEPGGRGFIAYVATYEPIPMEPVDLYRFASEPGPGRVDTVVVIDSFPVAATGFFSDLLLGGGVGVAAMSTEGMDFAVPALSIMLAKADSWLLTASGGWRPLGSTDNLPLDRAQAILSVEMTYFAEWYAGPTFGLRGAWETIREADAFIERAYGFYVGNRARRGPLMIGLDLQVSNLSRFGGDVSEWGVGVAVSANVHHMFR